jgi:benzoate-CoA ligase
VEPPRLEIPARFNAAAHFVDRHLAEGREKKTAIFYEERQLTYGQLAHLVNRTGNALRALGIEPEHRLLVLLLDCPEFAASFFGAIKIGVVPVPVNTNMQPNDYRYFLEDSRARALVISAALLPQAEPALKDLRFLRHVIVVGDVAGGLPRFPGVAVHDFSALIRAASGELAPEDLSADDVCYWLYSSGTTGFPKGAVHLQHDMLVATELYAKPILGLNASDVCHSVAKLFFAYGLGNALYFPLGVGAATVLYPGRNDPERVIQNVARYRPTLFFSVPTSYAACLQLTEHRREDLQSVRLCVSAGESLPPAVWERWRERDGVEILDGLGSTEGGHIFISNRAGKVKPGSSGQVVPGYEAKIVDDLDQRVPTGEVGSLLIKGDSACAYYWNQHERTKQTIVGEWLRTGDKYHRDEDGYYWYAGRSDDMIKVGGIWVSPVEVENALVGHPAVVECGVVGVDDADGLAKPKAFVVLRQGFAGSEALILELKAFVKERIAPYKYPRWIEFVPELPKTATGKIQRYKLRARGIKEGASAG